MTATAARVRCPQHGLVAMAVAPDGTVSLPADAATDAAVALGAAPCRCRAVAAALRALADGDTPRVRVPPVLRRAALRALAARFARVGEVDNAALVLRCVDRGTIVLAHPTVLTGGTGVRRRCSCAFCGTVIDTDCARWPTTVHFRSSRVDGHECDRRASYTTRARALAMGGAP